MSGEDQPINMGLQGLQPLRDDEGWSMSIDGRFGFLRRPLKSQSPIVLIRKKQQKSSENKGFPADTPIISQGFYISTHEISKNAARNLTDDLADGHYTSMIMCLGAKGIHPQHVASKLRPGSSRIGSPHFHGTC